MNTIPGVTFRPVHTWPGAMTPADDRLPGHQFRAAWSSTVELLGLELRQNGAKAFPRVAWVIVGGESGPDARPIHPQWARDLRDQCQAADVAFFMKQWGEWVPESQNAGALSHRTTEHAIYVALDGTTRPARTGARGTAATVQRVGKHAAGRLLDGREWSEYPDQVGTPT